MKMSHKKTGSKSSSKVTSGYPHGPRKPVVKSKDGAKKVKSGGYVGGTHGKGGY